MVLRRLAAWWFWITSTVLLSIYGIMKPFIGVVQQCTIMNITIICVEYIAAIKYKTRRKNIHYSLCLWVSTTPGNPGNPGNLLEFVWSSWKFCIKCRWRITLVSNHDNTGIASLRNWSPFFIFATVLCCAYHVFVIYLGKLLDSVHYIAGRSNANMPCFFLKSLLKSPGNLFSKICRHPVFYLGIALQQHLHWTDNTHDLSPH